VGLNYVNLDRQTRDLMGAELDLDLASGLEYLSPRLSEIGRHDYVDLLRDAMQTGSDDMLAASLASNGRLNAKETQRHPRGGPDIVKDVPHTASTTLAEGEFNRFYIRAVCRRAIDAKQATVIAYRARVSAKPRPESVALDGQGLDPVTLLNDLRHNIGVDTALGLPPGPNSGMSVRLA
jgi:hypothetical protein